MLGSVLTMFSLRSFRDHSGKDGRGSGHLRWELKRDLYQEPVGRPQDSGGE